jgi:hypothetical protein
MFNGKKCQRCEGKIKDSYDFCPTCGLDLANPERDMDDFGVLGKSNRIEGHPLVGGLGGFGITDKMINSLISGLAKSLEKQMGNIDMDPEVQSMPNGIKIRFGSPTQVKKKKKPSKVNITQEQISRMSGLPRSEAKSIVRRFSDKVVYEITAPGVEDVSDVFVSKLESGYEVKAIGKKKVYVNSIPVNLPLKGYSLNDQGLKVEFGLQ